ncbi:MAG: ATP-binding cassette domain-containing protein [Gammaproteobacteria bacterium]|nr:ATP-binding cassette domain-containing protein [Gammaproteobacteria bacterium]
MSALISLEKIYLSYGNVPLLDQVNFQIQPGERVCLIGRNGAGKSSFLKVVDGSVEPDSGKIHRESGLTIARLEQELPQDGHLTVYEVITQAFKHYSGESWESERLIQEILLRLDLSGSQKMADLSGGWKRRVDLAKALVVQPHLLLLDEPTNHLDIEAIQWLEDQLLKFRGGILFITHDRSLLRRLATRIIELDRGQLTSWPGNYDNFLRRKEEMLLAEENLNKEFDKKLAEEERWIRKGIQARRTRNEGRVRALKALREERQQRRDVLGKATLEINDAKQSGQLVIDAERVSHHYGEKTILKDFSLRIMRGDRIGLLGPNGVGKTTLLNILLDKMLPDKGEVKLGTKLDIAYFDQLRASLDLEKSVLDNVAGGRTSLTINGKERHVIGYMADFLFPPQRLNTAVKALSGGECNRLLLAQLFSLPANVLVMDEPTNDLDIETLELLEELLSQFSGTLLLVSHDRSFMDNIVTRTLAFEGNGKVSEYVGGYQDWLAQAPKIVAAKHKDNTSIKTNSVKQSALDAKEKKELAGLLLKIEKLEKQQQQLFTEMTEPGFYEQTNDKISQATEKLKKVEREIEQAYARWDELEGRRLLFDV